MVTWCPMFRATGLNAREKNRVHEEGGILATNKCVGSCYAGIQEVRITKPLIHGTCTNRPANSRHCLSAGYHRYNRDSWSMRSDLPEQGGVAVDELLRGCRLVCTQRIIIIASQEQYNKLHNAHVLVNPVKVFLCQTVFRCARQLHLIPLQHWYDVGVHWYDSAHARLSQQTWRRIQFLSHFCNPSSLKVGGLAVRWPLTVVVYAAVEPN
mmetsp:Transcript_12539/g.28294  ORF Transcript_12539/g.28294 Transcript_12539/m.28294 type:complete len:210 (+) Transcript_12539:2091-2720(+)